MNAPLSLKDSIVTWDRWEEMVTWTIATVAIWNKPVQTPAAWFTVCQRPVVAQGLIHNSSDRKFAYVSGTWCGWEGRRGSDPQYLGVLFCSGSILVAIGR